MKKKQEPRPRRPTALGYTLGEEREKKTPSLDSKGVFFSLSSFFHRLIRSLGGTFLGPGVEGDGSSG
jgi:hypothetical protein